MPRIADYSIIDHSAKYGNFDGNSTQISIGFQLPNTLDKESRSILAWMMNVPDGGVNLSVHINQHQIHNSHHDDGYFGPMFQVVSSGFLHRGPDNSVIFTFDVGATEKLFVSNVVLWWQANI